MKVLGRAAPKYPFITVLLGYLALASWQQTAGLTPEQSHVQNSCSPLTWMATVLPAMTRLTSTAPCSATTQAHVAAGRGEYQSFQILVSAGVALVDNVDLYASDLFGPAGSSINGRNVTLYREHAVRVAKGSPDTGGSNRPLGSGWYPDALIPLRSTVIEGQQSESVPAAAPFSISPSTSEVIWVDIYVPPDGMPGDYTGTISITCSLGMINLPVRLTVWRFTLPAKPSLKSSFGLHAPNDRDLETQLLLLRHKVMPLFALPEVARNSDEDGLNTTGIRLFGRLNQKNCTMDAAPQWQVINDMARLFPVDLPRYVYSADEAGNCPELFETIRSWGKAIHVANPAIKNLATIAPVPTLLDDGTGTGRSAVDIWVILPPDFAAHRAQIDQVLRKGDEVWSYTALVQDSYSPKWEIDFAPVNFRILPGFMSQSMGLNGLLYWRVDRWEATAWETAPVYEVPSSPNAYPGEGMLVYPGQQVGLRSVLPSMRLKWIRAGVQDYEYISLLKKLGRGEWAINISKQIATDWRQWTKDPNALETARYQLGCELDRLAVDRPGDGQ